MNLNDLRIAHEGPFDIQACKLVDELPETIQLDLIKHFHDTEDQMRTYFGLFQVIKEWWPENCKTTLIELHADIGLRFELNTEIEEDKQVVESISIGGQKLSYFVVTKLRNYSPFYVRLVDKQT